MIDASQIQEHMEVVGSDNEHVGTVDNVGVKLTKNDPAAGGEHHYLKLEKIAGVQNGKLVLNIPASEAFGELKVVE